jgi:1,4-alpha-glucan branching enzyme
MRNILVLVCFLTSIATCVQAQKVTLSPTVAPALFRAGDEITVTYDVTGTSLANLANAYIWVWIPDSNIDAKYNISPASSNTSATDNAKFTKTVSEGKTLFSITFIPQDFFEGDISNQVKLGMLLKGNDWSNGQTTDYVTDFWDGAFQVKLTSPLQNPLFVSPGETMEITAESPIDASFALYINDALIDETTDAKVYSYGYEIADAEPGLVRIVATSGSNSSEVTFQYLVSIASPGVPRPEGIIPGINYHDDQTTVTLCLLAPDKESVYVRGDFTNWQINPEYIMNRDGEYFWIQLSGITPGTEYAFQYLVDEAVYIADPFADKILDPDDQYIPASVYPGLKPFPQEARNETWYYNRVAVFQTNQTSYQWQVTDFQKPAKENLIIYEVLIRDFFDNGNRTYRSLADTIGYFKRLGVNAIQLMPVMEFNGNESWGYNPAFMFAPDKYYGHKNELKAFIDKCHQEGIAVILDIAMNHQDLPNAYVLMDYDFDADRPAASNRWFNPTARHPFNVFFDMNHESAYTKAYLDTINHYWLNEYKIDGFRFDLSKGFTQINSGDNVGTWTSYDASRIALLKRMADAIWSHTPDAIVILEHFADNREEKELAEYRADEGKGMMLWGNMNHAFNQLTMGYTENSDIRGTSHHHRDWSVPHLVSYMESHDEERLMYRNKAYGNSAGKYSARDEAVSIERIKAASTIFYSVPGPKMLWQFGELGYDYSINRCEDGSINDNCRVSSKPVTWTYKDDPDRAGLFQHTADLINLHKTYSVFTNGTATISSGNSLIRQVTVRNAPYTDTPASTDQMNVQVVANFELQRQAVLVDFPHTGIWYDYYGDGEPIQVNSLPHTIQLKAGGYKLFTDVPIGAGPVTAITESEVSKIVRVYPNPTNGRFQIAGDSHLSPMLTDMRGVSLEIIADGSNYDITHLPAGFYLLSTFDRNGIRRVTKIVKQ